ncbi:MAG: ComEA family DNA-binding protein [Bacilli bacterium]
MKKKLVICIGILLVIGGLFLSYYQPQEVEDDVLPFSENLTTERIIVQITGEVSYPGLYELASDARLHDLVALAGGFTLGADIFSINLASPLTDGTHIHIQQVTSQDASTNLISINQATKEQLMTLVGIGEVKADSIIAYRQQHGAFKLLEELMNVSGITASIYDKIKTFICL